RDEPWNTLRFASLGHRTRKGPEMLPPLRGKCQSFKQIDVGPDVRNRRHEASVLEAAEPADWLQGLWNGPEIRIDDPLGTGAGIDGHQHDWMFLIGWPEPVDGPAVRVPRVREPARIRDAPSPSRTVGGNHRQALVRFAENPVAVGRPLRARDKRGDSRRHEHDGAGAAPDRRL